MKLKLLAFGMVMWTVGYVCGNGNLPVADTSVTAQEEASGLSDDTTAKVRAAHDALKTAMEALQQDGKYEGLTDTPNAYLVLSGGGNAMEDLQSGQGVDPESFAAIYAKQVKPELQAALTTDDQGRILYNDQLVRMYSRSRLERLGAERVKLSLVGGSSK